MHASESSPASFGVGRIDFVNTAPVYLGIDRGDVACPGRVVAAPPAALNGLLEQGEIQISAVSSVAYARAFPRWLLLPDLSITAHGAIGSVVLARRAGGPGAGRPRIGLSDKSATAQALTRLVLEASPGPRPDYRQVDLSAGLPTDLDGLLLIGDDALRLPYRATFPEVVDLGAAWRAQTGLPMVFGVWAVDRAFAVRHPGTTARVTQALQASRDVGVADLEAAAAAAARRSGLSVDVCLDYLAPIDYTLGPTHVRALEHFFDRLAAHDLIGRDVEPSFFPADPAATAP